MTSSRPGTVVDSSVLLDVFTDDARWADSSLGRLADALRHGPLVINAVVLAEITPRFPRIETLRAAVPDATIVEPIPDEAAFLAGRAHLDYRRAGGTREATLPDFLIGAHAAVTGRPLLTRDPRRVAAHIPGAVLVTPVDD